MPIYTVKVKWGKEVYKDIELNTDERPELFKAQIYALTGVQTQRQKVLYKGVIVNDDEWGTQKITDGAIFLMMGSKDEVPCEPVIKPVFLEDMNETELASSLDLPGGLENLGNTCYMNATLQCLKSVPELRNSLNQYPGLVRIMDGQYPQYITAAMRDLFANLDKGSSVTPYVFLQLLQTAFPRFAEEARGTYVQQDANECWVELVRVLQQKLPAVEDPGLPNSTKAKSFIDQYFAGKFDVELKCTESDEEPISKSNEEFLQLSCFISQDIKYMINGLLNKMQEQITKRSTVLGKDAVFNKTVKISRLPAYLTIQFVRFYYKEKEKINAKILKDIQFPLEFDAYSLCCEELKEKLHPMRKKFKDLEEAEVADSLSKDKCAQNKKPEGTKKKKYNTDEPFSFPDDVGSNNSGYYELQAVLTHKGRSSSSGHYVAWIRYKDDTWVKCDDNVVTPVQSEDVLKLSGGGDWHCAYVLLYGPKKLKIPIVEN